MRSAVRASLSPRSSRVVGLVLLALITGAGCGRVDARVSDGKGSPADSARRDSVARAGQDSINRAQPGYIVDSILPIDEALRRFRAELPGPVPTALSGGTRSREGLVHAVVRALEARDSAALGALALTPAEFAWLVYPTSPFVAPPYRQMPGLVWMQIALGSGSGRARLLARLAGRPLGYAGHSCDGEPERQGENRIWRRCRVRLTQPDGTHRALRLFGDIVERAGHFKLVSFANDL
ncbi:MAG TPA: hypothetical protein VLE53_10410 [Gemmatimonadaceae bacterium]|nr:hypothetical protein [Gemmatimonadaceae bacterium]